MPANPATEIAGAYAAGANLDDWKTAAAFALKTGIPLESDDLAGYADAARAAADDWTEIAHAPPENPALDAIARRRRIAERTLRVFCAAVVNAPPDDDANPLGDPAYRRLASWQLKELAALDAALGAE